MATFTGKRPSWGRGFFVDTDEHDGSIRLAQRTDTHFKLESQIRYDGATGLEGRNPQLSASSDRILRNLHPNDLTDTDLASIPAPMRWWINTYGRHTPAALIHDRFIGLPEGLPSSLVEDGIEEYHIDRYFRFMLGDAGIPFTDRWIMWSAVALRTRWKSTRRRRILLVLWFALALVGLAGFIVAAIGGNTSAAWIFAVAPLPASFLFWGKQWGAGLVVAYIVFPLLLAPVSIAVALLAPFYVMRKRFSRALERAARRVFGDRIEPAYYADEEEPPIVELALSGDLRVDGGVQSA